MIDRQRSTLKARAELVLMQVMLTLFFITPEATGQASKLSQMQARDCVNKGNVYMNRRQYQEALAEYQKALDLDAANEAARNNIVLTHLNWGAVYYSQNKFEEALKEWETVLKLDPYNQSAKHNVNVLKQTLARRGLPMPGKPGGQASQGGKKAQPAAVILTPTVKQSEESGSSTTGAEDATGAAPEAAQPPASGQAAPALGPESQSEAAAPAKATPAAGSIEDQLSALELKIYGRKQGDMAVFKRLEKMELDTAGQVRTGTIKERIDFLKRSYGL